ncbi:MAG: hypothetical protein ACK4NC_02755 [Candidatus Gracilibacteria bacterium]
MKKQDKIDGQNPNQIFNTNFHSEVHGKKRKRASLALPAYNIPLILWGGVIFLILSLLFSTFFILRVSPRGENIMGSLSLSRLISQERQNRQVLESKVAETKTTLSDTGKDIDKLLISSSLDSLPELAVARELFTKKINWFRAYVGIDQTIKQIVAANDILKKITIGSISFDQANKKVLLENVRAYGTYYGVNEDQKSGSSISLAAGIVDAFEQSSYFKDISVDEYTRRQELGSGALLTEFFTPIILHATLQDPDESNAKDKKTNIEQEINSLKKNPSDS